MDQKPNRRLFLSSALAFLGGYLPFSMPKMPSLPTSVSWQNLVEIAMRRKERFQVTIRTQFPYPMTSAEYKIHSKRWKKDCDDLRGNYARKRILLREITRFEPTYMEVVMTFRSEQDWQKYQDHFSSLRKVENILIRDVKASLGFQSTITTRQV